MTKCDHNCLQCKYSDCINDEITVSEIISSMQRDTNFANYGTVRKGRPTKSRKQKEVM